ncbi:hypothetical protein G3578_11515 [Brevibacillus sp. SYP-B805]|jgi:hypothetical protein|uniref:hypothetical protein n=1 Tax=Brevibacillus sp. SYP-B805 TaxID=1578199 RepID=UPI0013EB285A|nr:hypothetical protein [Brevibacillus sp. SYP-B805]NGQ95782.1 hypothetical protein [Brevibacillus sp. SYP-B805]
MEEQTIDYHLSRALFHLETALNLSVRTILEDEAAKRPVGSQWEMFLGEFFGHVREKGKKSRINLLQFISFPRIR